MIDPPEKLVFCAECPCSASRLRPFVIVYAVIGGLPAVVSARPHAADTTHWCDTCSTTRRVSPRPSLSGQNP